MDEKAITLAAEAAIKDLELECEVEKVDRVSGADKWRITFSPAFGEYRDDFKNQFGKENSAKVMREKLKGYLLKQVTRIRSSTGKSRRPRAIAGDRAQKSQASRDAYKFIDDAFDRASKIVGQIGDRAAGIADTARAAVADVADRVMPVTIEVSGVSSEIASRSKRPLRKAPTKRKLRPTKKKSTRKSSTKPASRKTGKKSTSSSKKR